MKTTTRPVRAGWPRLSLIPRLWALLFALPLAWVPTIDTHANAGTAQIEQLTCAIGATLTLDPGLGLTAARQDIGGIVHAGNQHQPGLQCASQTGITYTGAIVKIKGSGELACITVGGLTGSASGTGAVTWYEEDEIVDHSRVDWSVTAGGIVPVVTVTNHGGQLDGATVVVNGLIPTGISGNCAEGSRVTSASFTSAASFVK